MGIEIISSVKQYSKDELHTVVKKLGEHQLNAVLSGGALILVFDAEDDDPNGTEADLIVEDLNDTIPEFIVDEVNASEEIQFINDAPEILP